MLVHVRLTVPGDLTAAVVEELTNRQWITNVTLQHDACLVPPGDLVECDVAREKAGSLLDSLERLGVTTRGGVVATEPLSTPFSQAARMDAAAPGHPDDAVIWDAVESAAEAGSVPTLSFHVFLIIAVMLASIAVIVDSSVLVVGAMVVGPEFSAIVAACVGIVLRRPHLVMRSLRLLLFSFAFAVLVVTAFALVARGAGLITPEMVTAPRPNTGFIWHPDRWSFIVALLAGAAGALALAVSRTSIMVGVFISVTTVPAAGNLALGLAVWDGGEIGGSLAQLGANVAGMIVAGTVVLALMRRIWPWLTARSDRLFGVQPAHPRERARAR